MKLLLAALFSASLILPGIPLACALSGFLPQIGMAGILIIASAVSVALLSSTSLTLAAFGAFSLPGVWLLTILASLLSAYLLRASLTAFIRQQEFLSKGTRREILLLAVVFLSAWCSFPAPATWMTNYHMDSGRYSNIASFILNKGSITLENSVGDSSSLLPKQDRDWIQGYYPKRRDKTHFVAPFTHLYPSLLAFARGHLGIYHSFKLNWFLGILGAGLFYLIIRLYTGQTYLALIGALLVFTNPACQLFFNRNMTEPLSFALLQLAFVAIFALSAAPSRLTAFLAAFVFALLATCRLEFGLLYPLPALIIAALAPRQVQDSNSELRFFIKLQLASILILAPYYDFLCGAYFAINVDKLLDNLCALTGIEFAPLRGGIVVIWAGITAICLLAAHYLLEIGRPTFLSDSIKRRLPLIGALSFAAFLLWNLLIRPWPALMGEEFHHDRINLWRLLSFIDPLAVILSPLGLFYALRDKNRPLFATFCLVLMFTTLIKSGHSEPVLWWARRFVPVVIPAFYFFYLVAFQSISRGTRRMLLAASLVFNCFITFCQFRASFAHDEVRLLDRPPLEQLGALGFYSDLAALFDAKSVQLCLSGDSCNRATVPLHSHFNIPTLYLKGGMTESKVEYIKHLLGQGQRVLLTYNDFPKSPFSDQDVHLLKAHGIGMKKIKIGQFTALDPIGFNRNFRTSRSIKDLLIPASFSGLKFKKRGFPSRVFEFSLINNPKLAPTP